MADETPKKSKIAKWLIILLLILILGGGGSAYYFFYMPHDSLLPAGAEKSVAEKAERAFPVTLPTFMVNLADPLGRRYIKLTLEIEVNGEETVKSVNDNMARIRDSIILLLSSKSYADLAPMENKLHLKNEIVERLNQILGGPKVARVYFSEIIIQ